MEHRGKNRLGDILVEKDIIRPEQLSALLELQKDSGERLGDLVVKNGMATEKQILDILSYQLGVPIFEVLSVKLDPKVTALISESLANKYTIIPIRIDETGTMVLAMADPLDLNAIEEAELAAGMMITPVLDSARNILKAIHLYYSRQYTEKALRELDNDMKYSFPELDADGADVLEAPAIRLVSSVVRQAVVRKASDIHIEPLEKDFRVRFRIHGELTEILRSPLSTHAIMVTRIKILGHMNIAEKRVPQDGRVALKLEGREIDLRISTLPTVNGEKVVIRILDHSRLEQLRQQTSLSILNSDRFKSIISQSSGMILVTGPTGSGKTTTLYSVLSDLNSGTKNIITIEDPVEYRLTGINQTQVNNKAGYTFANGLRAILRQDPNIIMVGEIRDVETAQIAIRASITGHLVFSTMHTQDTASTLSRLLDMNIEPHMLSSALAGIVAQRLIRSVCKVCRERYEASSEEKLLLGIDEDTPLILHRSAGCQSCGNTGYKDRFAIYEIMPVYREIRDLIHGKASTDEIRDRARQRYGLVTLKESLVQLVLEGETTTEELRKISFNTED